MALLVHRADRADVLAQGLADLLATAPEDPFERDVVVVAAEGVQRWLAQTLSHRLGAEPDRQDGICAGIEFVRPGRLVADLSDREVDDPWSPDRLTWTVLEVLTESLDEPWLGVVARHVGRHLPPAEQALRRSRLYATARRTAGLLHGYARQRPVMTAAWSSGADTDGHGMDLPAECTWQAELWRRCVGRLGSHPSPDVRLATAAASLREGTAGADLPARISFLGHTRMPAAELDLVEALGHGRDVHLWLPHPSPARWDRTTRAPGPLPRRAELTAPDGGNVLLTACSLDVTELQLSLPPAQTRALPLARRADSLLGRLQDDLVADRPAALRPAGQTPPSGPAELDDSVQVHACHGAARQVDVLREAVLGLLADDPTLEPRDVLVMCPDVESFAPLIQAAFGLDRVDGVDHPGHDLRVRLADRSTATTNPVAQVLQRLVAIAAAGRSTVTELRDLLALDPVRRRFALSEDDLETVGRWLAQTGVRWGVDADDRASWDLAGLAQNTWAAGLDRLLLGVTAAPGTAADGNRLGDVLPMEELTSTDVDLAGRLAEVESRVGTFLREAGAPQSRRRWADLLQDVVLDLTDVAPRDAWQVDQVLRVLATLAPVDLPGDAEAIPSAGMLTAIEVAAVLADRFAPRPTRSNFRTGSLTICTMVPMRSVPHRVVCLLGLDADAFPRTPTPLGDDILARRPVVGERDAAAEDRQLFLDAILAATDHLVITYTGASEHTGRPLPAATPVGELLDQLDRTAPGARDHVVVRHPLQAFDARSFTVGGLEPGRSFSFDPTAFAGARATLAAPAPVPPFLDGATSAATATATSTTRLDDLRGLLAHPVRFFVRERLGVTLVREDVPADDAIPLDLDALERWQLSSRLLASVLAGADGGQAEADERRRGDLPPGGLAEDALAASRRLVGSLFGLAQPWRDGPARSVDVEVALDDGRQLRGAVADVRDTHALRISPSRLGASQLAPAWVDALVLAASDQGRPVRLVGRVQRGRRAAPGLLTLRPPERDVARTILSSLLELLDLGLVEPLPMPARTSFALAEGLRARPDDLDAAEARASTAWVGNPDLDIDGEDADAYHRLVLGPAAPYRRLAATTAGGLTIDQLAARVWNPLLDHLDHGTGGTP